MFQYKNRYVCIQNIKKIVIIENKSCSCEVLLLYGFIFITKGKGNEVDIFNSFILKYNNGKVYRKHIRLLFIKQFENINKLYK